jgi:hypothetical protein
VTATSEAFFRLVQKYNETAPDGEHLGPKKFTSTKSLRDYLKKGQAQIRFYGSRDLRNYNQMISEYEMQDWSGWVKDRD